MSKTAWALEDTMRILANFGEFRKSLNVTCEEIALGLALESICGWEKYLC